MRLLKCYIVLIGIIAICPSWGFFAHKRINESAVYLLPSEIAGFYKSNIKIITEKAVDADKRCYVDSLEGPKHYIDIDRLETDIDSITIHWSKAVQKVGEQRLRATGIVPWQIFKTYQNLVQALKNKETNLIIRYSADLGHYVADAHVPLHTTSNYNGQYTNQVGIHAFWETRLPEMFADQYNYFIGSPIYIQDPLETAWNIVKASNSLVDSVLSLEKELSNQIKHADQKTYLTRNNQLIHTYSDIYASAYHQALGGMVERRFRASILLVASLWYSAWIDAGQPNLSIQTISVEDEFEINHEQLKNKGREEWH